MEMLGLVLSALCFASVNAWGSYNPLQSDDAELLSCPAATNCPTGYTGGTCDLIMCPTRSGTPYAYNKSGEILVEIRQLSYCSGSFQVPVDSHMRTLQISIYANVTSDTKGFQLLDPTGYDVTSQMTVSTSGQTLTAVLTGIARKTAFGVYTANINLPGGCTFSAYTETNLLFQAGFTYGDNYMFSDNIQPSLPENTPGALVGFLTSLFIPGFAYEVKVYKYGKLQAFYPIIDRLNCMYHTAVGPVTCNSIGDLWYEITGIDEKGFQFRRTDVLSCTAPTTTVSPMSTTQAPCLNGGVYNQITNKCDCGFYFEGPICQQPVCFNGGTVVQNGCACPPGYVDQNCLEVGCPVNSNTTFSPYGRSLVLLVQNTVSMQSTLNYIADYGMEMYYDFMLQYPGYIVNFVIVTFNPSNVNVLCNTNNATVIQNALFNLANSPVPDSSCSEMFYSGVIAALGVTNPSIINYSQMYVFANGPPVADVTKSSQVNDLLQNTRTAMFFYILPTPSTCTNSPSTFSTYNNLADFSGGAAMLLSSYSDSYQAMQLIPTAFQRQQIFAKSYQDCSSNKLSAFVPIDSHTAGVQIFFSGSNPAGLSVYQPNGIRYNSPYMFLQDNNNIVEEVITPCSYLSAPNGLQWNQYGTKCYLGVNVNANWYDANAYCQSYGGSLLTVLNQEKQNLQNQVNGGISQWFALNDLGTVGTFQWAGVGGQSFPLGNQYVNWAPGQPNTTVPGVQCGVIKQQMQSNGSYVGQWYLDDCNKKYPYVCERHTVQFESRGINGPFSPGIWRFDFQTSQSQQNNSNYYNNSCQFTIYAQSNMQAFYGFNTGNSSLTGDMPSSEPSLTSTTNRYLTTLTNVDQSLATVSQVDFYDGYYNLQLARNMYHRVNCSYNYVSDPFSCPSGNFATVLTGIDDNGYTFNRYDYGICISS